MLDPNPTVDPVTPAGLSARESEVIALVSLGLTNTQIAGRLGVAVHTVKFHLAAIYRKLGVANRTEATAVYLRPPGLGAFARQTDVG